MTRYGTSALLTGGTGFLGVHLARRLLAEGVRVHCVVRPTSDRGRLPAGVAAEEHDGTTEGLGALVARVRPTIVFHLAARFVAEHRPGDVAGLVLDNVLFSSQLFEAMVRAGCHRLVNTGTAWQHRGGAAGVPVTLYAATKQAAEDVLRYYTDASPLRAVTLKLHDTYGPNDPRVKLFTLLARTAAAGTPLPMSPGEQQLELVHVDDVVAAFLVAAERLARADAPAHECFAVAAARRYSLREVVRLYGEITGRRADVVWGGRPYREREVMVPWDGPVLPGWEARIALPDGLRTLGGA